jgi:transcriptional regulator with XRE-family HTH domain
LSQLDLALEAEVSTRHLSFVETGRAHPSRSLLLQLAESLEVPLRERNALLLAGGFAPLYTESPLDAGAMEPVRAAIESILAGHEPFPAIVVDRRWNLVSANRPAQAILNHGVAPALLTPPVNVLRVALHPRGLAPRIANLRDYGAHLLQRLHRAVALSADVDLAALEAELRGYLDSGDGAEAAAELPLSATLVLRASESDRLTFFSTIATFGSAAEITTAELSIESFFPADAETAATLRAAWH